MADANPSGLGYAVPEGGKRPEANLKANEEFVKRSDGVVVRRRLMTNGNVQDEAVWTQDFKDRAVTEEAWRKKNFPSAAQKKAAEKRATKAASEEA